MGQKSIQASLNKKNVEAEKIVLENALLWIEITLLFPWIDKCFFSCVALKATSNRDFKNAGKWNERKGVFQIPVSEVGKKLFYSTGNAEGK